MALFNFKSFVSRSFLKHTLTTHNSSLFTVRYSNSKFYSKSYISKDQTIQKLAKMVKAIEISNYGGVEGMFFKEVELPSIKENEVLIENKAIGVNFIDTYHRSGVYKLPLPLILGREGAGIVKEVGPGVQGFKAGDRVAYMSQGAYATEAIINHNNLVKLPDTVSFELGASAVLQGLTALTMVELSHKVQQGDYILVHAVAGGMGLVLTQMIKNLGGTVIGTTSTQEKADLAKKVGADHVILYNQSNVAEQVMKITNNKGVNAVFDGVGKDTFELSIQCCGHLATFVSFGNASGTVPPVDIFKLTPKNIKLMRTSLFSFFTDDQAFNKYATELFQLIEQDKIDFSNFNKYDLKDAGQAHQDLEGRKTTGKLILIP